MFSVGLDGEEAEDLVVRDVLATDVREDAHERGTEPLVDTLDSLGLDHARHAAHNRL